MINSALGIADQFIREHEGKRLYVYLDGAGIKTDGYGNTYNVGPIGSTITELKAESDLQHNLRIATSLLEQRIKPQVLLKLSEYEQAALISFVFNAGCGKTWRIWKLLNAKQFKKIPDELMRFDHIKVNGQLVESKGLKNRRQAEVDLWRMF